MSSTQILTGEKNMFGQLLKDATLKRLEDYAKAVLERDLKPVEYNMFLFHYGDALDRIYSKCKAEIDQPVLEFIAKLKEKDENTST